MSVAACELSPSDARNRTEARHVTGGSKRVTRSVPVLVRRVRAPPLRWSSCRRVARAGGDPGGSTHRFRAQRFRPRCNEVRVSGARDKAAFAAQRANVTFPGWQWLSYGAPIRFARLPASRMMLAARGNQRECFPYASQARCNQGRLATILVKKNRQPSNSISEDRPKTGSSGEPVFLPRTARSRSRRSVHVSNDRRPLVTTSTWRAAHVWPINDGRHSPTPHPPTKIGEWGPPELVTYNPLGRCSSCSWKREAGPRSPSGDD